MNFVLNKEVDRRSLADRLLFGGLLLVLVLAPWPWGGTTEIARSALGLAAALLLAGCAAGVAAGALQPPRLSVAARMALVVWLAWLSWIGLQLLPLSPGLLEDLSPLALRAHDRLREVNPGARYSLSIAPGLTLAGLLDSLMLFAFYCLTLVLVDSRERIRTLLGALFFAGVLQALYGIHMTVSGMEYGFFAKKTVGIGWATGTFVNRNHFAAYMELVAAAGIGLILMDVGSWRWPSWAGFLRSALDLLLSRKFRTRVLLVALVVAVVLSRSRMGNVALFSAIPVAGLLYALLRVRSSLVPALLLFGSMALVDLMVVSRWYGLDEVIERISETDIETEQRPLVFQDVIPAIEDYWLTGAGLGTFASAFSPYRSVEVWGYIDHAHNEYAEFLLETGVVGLGILATLVAIHLLHALRVMALRRRAVYAGAAFATAMAVFAMLIHGAVEFMLHMPAVALTWVVLLALTAGIRSRRSERPGADSVISVTQSA